MKNNIIHRVISNKNNYRYIAACVFIVAAGIVYSLSRLMSNSGDPEYEYSISTKPSATQTTELSQEPTTQDKNIYAYICGAVANPGVYRVPEGTRIYEAVELAGGYVEGADISAVNLADKIADGQKVYIPAEGEEPAVNVDTASSGMASKININTASESELTSLPGIGESRAKDIVNYRTKNGFFNSIEDIKNVTGIKEAAFEKIKDYIRV